MPKYDNAYLAALVEKDRVHRSVYTDPAIFDLEMERIWGKAWIYVGHESQVKNAGDYITTTIGRQPVIMVRHSDGQIRVLFNRCAHKGACLVAQPSGHAKTLRCCYHGWVYDTAGTCIHIPNPKGYEGTGFDMGHPLASIQRVPRVAEYRGFIFGSLSSDGPDLRHWLGAVADSIDNLIDRSPEGRIEIAGGSFRYLHRNNWKMWVENLNDSGHPMITHRSSAGAARTVGTSPQQDTPVPFEMEMLMPFINNASFFEAMDLHAADYGHCWDGGKESIHAHYSPVTEYDKRMVEAYGEARAGKILSMHRHNTIVYPSFTLKGAITAIRIVKPLSVDRTIVESWVFRQVGAPEEVFRRSITYCNIINSQANLVGPDDAEAYERLQTGLGAQGNDWVSQHRYFGQETDSGQGHFDATGTSDQSFRNMFKAWKSYMTGAEGSSMAGGKSASIPRPDEVGAAQ